MSVRVIAQVPAARMSALGQQRTFAGEAKFASVRIKLA